MSNIVFLGEAGRKNKILFLVDFFFGQTLGGGGICLFSLTPTKRAIRRQSNTIS